MILLKDLFSSLASGEFSNITLTKDRNGNLDESHYNQVISHINLGLVEIYKRFKLMEKEVVLYAYPERTFYYLRPEFTAKSGSITEEKYIEQPEGYDGFLNLIEVKAVYNEEQKEVVLNNRFYIPSIRQVSDDVLQIKNLEAPHKFSIVYQAHPSPIVLNDSFDLNYYTLNIPKTIIEPLLYYVASRVYKPMGANNSTVNADKSDSFQQKYELACQKLTLFGLDIDIHDNDLGVFEREGWV